MTQAERGQPAFFWVNMKRQPSKNFAEISTLYNFTGILTNLNVDVFTKNEKNVFFHFIMAYLMYSWNQLNPVVPRDQARGLNEEVFLV